MKILKEVVSGLEHPAGIEAINVLIRYGKDALPTLAEIAKSGIVASSRVKAVEAIRKIQNEFVL
jgi:hypothetical protein